MMKITILTPSFNQGEYIEQNIQSVMSQNYANFEHIVIDGGSRDNTIKILRKYPHLKWVSGPDEGQADALNKGLAMATGDIVGWINSDDYYQEGIFGEVVAHFEDEKVQWLVGDVTYVYKELAITQYVKSKEITFKKLLKNPDIVKQQGVFFRKKLLQEVGGWNKDFHMAMDYDLWVRLSKKCTPRMVHNNYAYFFHHADQKSTPRNTLVQVKEFKAILVEHKAAWLDIHRMVFRKIYYLLKSLVKNLLIAIGILDKKYANISMNLGRKSKSDTMT